MYLAVQRDTVLKVHGISPKLSGFIALAEGCIIVVKRGGDMCGVVPDPQGEGEISR